MNAWLAENPLTVDAIAAFLFVAALVFFILWLLASRNRRRQQAARIIAENDRFDSEVALQDEIGRLRIVRELNEVAVHTVSVIISQADGAQYAAKTDPDAAVRAAATIAEMGRAALADLRRVVTIAKDGEVAASPQPRLKSFIDLFRTMRDAGIDVEYVETGERFDIGEGAELAIFRIVQEALSNSLKHGGEGTTAKVTTGWTAEGIQVLIDDDGDRTSARRQGLDPNIVAQQRPYTMADDLNALTEVVTGRGITEMRERAELFGGILKAYSVPGVGFSVSAIFPALKYNNGVHGVNLGA